MRACEEHGRDTSPTVARPLVNGVRDDVRDDDDAVGWADRELAVAEDAAAGANRKLVSFFLICQLKSRSVVLRNVIEQ